MSYKRMESSNHEPTSGSGEPDATFLKGCEINAQVVAACSLPLEFRDLYGELSTCSYEDERFFTIARLSDAQTMACSEDVRELQLAAATTRTRLTNAVIQVAQDLLCARKEIAIEYACDPSSAEAGSLPSDTILGHLQSVSLESSPVDLSRNSPYNDRVTDVAAAEYIAHHTNDVETALVTTRRQKQTAFKWLSRVNAVRHDMEVRQESGLSREGRYVGGIHVRIQKAVADLAVHDCIFYNQLNETLCGERDDRAFVAYAAFLGGDTAEMTAQEPDDMITFFVQASQYGNDAA